MPEYSSTTITPSDGVQVPSMNGSTSGNFLLSALKSYILSEKGLANGLASLDANGKLPSSQLPDLADDVIVVASYASLPATGTAGKIYITADNNKMYRWDPDLATPDYVELSIDLSEYARIEDIQQGYIQAGIAVKAFQDAMGRAIITTYETKADASDLKDAIQGNSQRIENLEVAVSGSLVQTNTDATMANTKTITNANEILPWAILKRVGARAVAWNQLVSNGNFENTTGWNAWGGSIEGASNNTLEVNVSSTASYGVSVSCNLGSPTVLGHKCLVSFRVKVSDYTKVKGSRLNRPFSQSVTFSDNNWVTFNAIAEVTYATGFEFGIGSTDGTLKAYFQVVNVFDLTTMNEASLTADQFRAKFPASYYPYNTGSIIPLNPSAFKVVGWNKAETVLVDKTSSNYTTVLRADGELLPNTTYCLSFVGVAGNLLYPNERLFTTEKIFTATGSRQSLILTTQGVVSKNETAQFNSGGWRLLKNANGNSVTADFTEVCINISQTDTSKPLHNGVYEAYKETTIDTSFTSDYKYVNESCYDYVENVLVDGVMRRKEHKGIVGEVNLGELADSYFTKATDGSFVYFYINQLPVPVERPRSNVSAPRLCPSSKYNVTMSANDSWNARLTTDSISVPDWCDLMIIDNSATSVAELKSNLSGVILRYKKKNASAPTDSDPMPNIPCEDGTTITAITPQTELVNAIDVPSTIAYMTKIGG